MFQVRLYTRPGCHLCEELKANLADFQRSMAFSLMEYNIEESADTMKRYRTLIPVLDIEGGPMLYPPHTWSSVRAALLAASKRHDK